MDADMGLNRIVGYGIFAAVEAIGEDATNVTPGQNFVLRLLEPCGGCPACKRGSGQDYLHGLFADPSGRDHCPGICRLEGRIGRLTKALCE